MSTLKIVIAIIGLMVLLSIAGVVAKIVFFPAHALKTGIDSAYDITDKTLSGDNVIYNYEWFKRQYEDIKATENKRDIAKKQSKSIINKLNEIYKEFKKGKIKDPYASEETLGSISFVSSYLQTTYHIDMAKFIGISDNSLKLLAKKFPSEKKF